jgi:hypothetical protein
MPGRTNQPLIHRCASMVVASCIGLKRPSARAHI